MDILTANGLEEHITCETPVQREGEEKGAYAKRLVEWKAKDKQALTHIRLCVSDATLVYISSATSAYDAWQTLEQTYRPTGIYSLVTARCKLFRTECTEGGDVAEHLRKMHALFDETNTMSEKAVISDDNFVIVLLMSLPALWDSFVQSIDSSGMLTSAKVMAQIIQEDRRRKEKGGTNKEALLSKQQKKKSRPKCFACRKTGHLKRDCKDPKAGKQTSGGEKANEMIEFAMIAIEANELALSAKEIILEQALISAYESRIWFGDSGATTHVSNSHEVFFTYSPLRSGAGIKGLSGHLKIVGRGSIKLNSKVGDTIQTIWLHDIAHVLGTPHDLLSLARADAAGCKYVGEGGTLTV